MNWGRSVITVTLVAISSIVGALGTASVRAQNATPAADCPATTLEENKALVEGYWKNVYNAHDPQRAPEYLADDYVRNNPSRPQPTQLGLADDITYITENLKDYPDLQVTIDQMVAEGDMVSALVTWNGTQRDSVSPWNAPAGEKPASYWLMIMYRVECGKLAEQWVVADYLSMLRQEGIVTDDELATLGSAADAVATPQP
jgi:predicted SnoaL-like aldol condensation-catalyzing enzyme